jgi:hypothetical protein
MRKEFFNLSGKAISKAKALEFLLNKSEPKCMWCKCWLDKYTATIEHITRTTDGGDNFLDNLGLACSTCNHRRHDANFVIPDNSNQLPLTTKDNKVIDWSLRNYSKKNKSKKSNKQSKEAKEKAKEKERVKKEKDLINKATDIFIEKNKLKDTFCCTKCKCFLDQHTVVTYCSFVSEDFTKFKFAAYCKTCYEYQFAFKSNNNVDKKELPFRNKSGRRCFTKLKK